MKLFFSFRLLYLIAVNVLKLTLTFVKRYQPLFLISIISLLIIMSLLLEAVITSIISSPVPSSYDKPTQEIFSQKQLLELQLDWKMLEKLQPESEVIKLQIQNLENAMSDNK